MENLTRILNPLHTAFVQLTDAEAHDIVMNSRRNPLEAWRKLLRRFDPNAAGRKRNLLKAFVPPGRCSMHELQGASGRWESHVPRYEQKLRSPLDNELKLAGMEALAPEELERHLMLNAT